MQSVREKIEERNRLIAENRRLLDGAKGGQLSAEQGREWDTRDADIDRLQAEIDDAGRRQRRADRSQAYDRLQADGPGRQTAAAGAQRPGPEALTADVGRFKVPVHGGTDFALRADGKYDAAFRTYLLNGGDGEHLGLMVSNDTKGGFLAPVSFVNRLIKFLDDTVWMRQLATVLPPLGDAVSLGVPTYDADPNDADWTPEVPASDVTEDDAMRFGKREFMPHLFTKLVKASKKFIRSATLDVEGFIARRLAYKFAITEEKAFLTGDGNQKPLGVFVASGDGIPATRDVVCAAANAFTADELIDLTFSVREQYRSNATWLASRDFVKRTRKLKDANNQYLWTPGLSGTPGTILDRPYRISEHVPAEFTTGKYVAAFGDFKAGYWIADSMNFEVQRLNELGALKNQVLFLGSKETDGAPALPEAVSRMRMG